jgi:hypothetical protein
MLLFRDALASSAKIEPATTEQQYHNQDNEDGFNRHIVFFDWLLIDLEWPCGQIIWPQGRFW